MKLLKDIIIAIDGYSSCGKSTLAKNLARILGYRHIDTGAMYRAVTLWSIENNYISFKQINKKELINSLEKINIEFKYNPLNCSNELWLNNRLVEDDIRKPIVSEYASLVSQFSEVRQAMVSIQKMMGKEKRIVMDGRDIGTVVFPDADLKIFMTADPKVRAQRRLIELKEKGIEINYDEVLRNIIERDNLDSNREISPLKKADDAILFDNSFMSKEDQLIWIIGQIKSRFLYED